MENLHFIPAQPSDATLLTKTALSSKRIWQYTDAEMELWTDDLTITASYIQKNQVFNIFDGETFIGFFSLVFDDESAELDHFWLLPENIMKGYGRKTFEFIIELLKKNNYHLLEVYSEPNSDDFYKKMSGKIIRRKESKIKNRFLNVFEFKI